MKPLSPPPPFRCALALALVLAVALAAFPAVALADDGDDNLVDPAQRSDNSFIYDTTIESLFDQASLYDNRTVQVVGEVIGDRIRAEDGEGCWITLTVVDDENKATISVLLSDEQANQIDRYGKYGVTGTILQVRGEYHQACDEHAGLSDIHATDASVQSKGVNHPDKLNVVDFAPGTITILIGAALMAVFYYARERMR